MKKSRQIYSGTVGEERGKDLHLKPDDRVGTYISPKVWNIYIYIYIYNC
jgi:hypothetical protein